MKTQNQTNQLNQHPGKLFHFDFGREVGWPAVSDGLLHTTEMGSQNLRERDVEIVCRSMELRAAARIASQPHLNRYCHQVHFYFDKGCLIIAGSVPTFYLKQVIQETVRKLEGVDRVDNRLEVVHNES